MPVVVSSALETSVGIRAGVALAAALPELPYACGLNTVALLTDDVADTPLVAVAGRLAVGELVVDDEALARCGAAPEVAGYWQSRWASTNSLAEARRG